MLPKTTEWDRSPGERIWHLENGAQLIAKAVKYNGHFGVKENTYYHVVYRLSIIITLDGYWVATVQHVLDRQSARNILRTMLEIENL